MNDHHSKGGRSRAERLPPDRRREIASHAARARWGMYGGFFREIRERLGDASDADLDTLCDLIKASSQAVILGNGGSAAIASHVAVDFTKVLGLPTLTFHDPALITCFANDYGFDLWMASALEAFAPPDALIVVISSSGASPDILNAARYAKDEGMPLVTLSGFEADNPLRKLGTLNLHCASSTYNCVEAVHLIWLLACVEKLANG